MSNPIPSTTFEHGSKSSIGTVILQLSTSKILVGRSVTITAASGNSGTVFIGKSDVTAGSDDATDGFPLDKGDAVEIFVDNVDDIFAVTASGPANKKVFWILT